MKKERKINRIWIEEDVEDFMEEDVEDFMEEDVEDFMEEEVEEDGMLLQNFL